jgi:transposase
VLVKQNRKQYSKEFKVQAVQLVQSSDKKVSEIASDLGINSNMLNRWCREYEQAKEHSFSGQGHRQPGSDLEEEVRRLKEELLFAQMERDILKKAVAIFSKPQK